MKGKFSGVPVHIVYHTVNPKKTKAADCYYLDGKRTCNNKKCPQYWLQCFDATHCSFRLREKDAERLEKKDSDLSVAAMISHIKKIGCTLPIGCPIYSKAFGEGKLVEYNETSKTIRVAFGEKEIKFIYPQAIMEKHIALSEEDYDRLFYDIINAEYQ